MATGRVLQFDSERGYGFIAADDGGEDVFLHASVLEGDSHEPAPGMRLEFQVMAGDRGRKAFAAHLIADNSGAGRSVAPEPEPKPAILPVMVSQAGQAVTGTAGPAPDDEQLCDVLSSGELEHELTEILLSKVQELTGQQVIAVRTSVLECARKHGWTDT